MNQKGQASIFLGVAAFFFILLILGMGFDYVPAGHVGVKVRFGNVYDDHLEPGIHWTGLFTSTEKMNARVQRFEYPASAASQDLQVVNAKITLNFKVIPTSTPEMYKTLGLNYQETIIQPLIQETIKANTAKFRAEELITKRADVKSSITTQLTERLRSKGLTVTEVAITDFEFSDQFNTAIEAKVTAEQKALEEQNKLAVVEFQAQQKVAQARGEAEAIQVVNEQLARSPKYIEYMSIQKWNGVMPLAVGENGLLLSITKGSEN